MCRVPARRRAVVPVLQPVPLADDTLRVVRLPHCRMTPGSLEMCATVGSLLLRADDAHVAGRALEHYLRDPQPQTMSLLTRLGVDAALARDLRPVLPNSDDDLARI